MPRWAEYAPSWARTRPRILGRVAAAEDLLESLAGLSDLLLGAQPYDEALRQVADFAVHAVPGADGTSVSLVEAELPATRVASHAFVRAVDAVQYTLGQGPCVDAVRLGRPVVATGLEIDERYPAFGPQAADLGVRSALATPLVVQGICVGAINTYAHRAGAFDDAAVRVAQLFAGPAGVVLANARVLERTRQLAEQMQAALASRAVIEQAKGVLMAQEGLDAEQAFARLRQLSQTRHVKLRDVAASVVAEAGRRHHHHETGREAAHRSSAAS